MSRRQASIRHRIVSPRQNSSAAMLVETELGVCCVQTSEQPECGDTNTARTVLLSTLAVCIGILLAGLVIAFYTIARIRKKPRHGHSETMGMMDGASNTTITPSHTRGAWSEHDLAAVSPASGQRLASGSSSPAVSGSAGERTGVLPGAFGSISGKMAGAASFGSVMGGTVKLGEETESPRSGSRDNDGASQASLGKSVLTLKDGMGGRKASGHFASGSWQSGSQRYAHATTTYPECLHRGNL